MTTRTTRSMVTFPHPFALAGYGDQLPAGEYEVIVDEERLEGLSFEAFRRTATYLMVHGQGRRAGRMEMLQITDADLKAALNLGCAPDRPQHGTTDNSEAALSPQED